MTNADQKKLEKLYEQIAIKDKQLLKKEKEAVDVLSNIIVEDLYKNISERYSNMRFYGSERLNSLLSPKLLTFKLISNAFNNVEKKYLDAIFYVFEKGIMHILSNYLVYVAGRDVPQKVCFRPVSGITSSFRSMANLEETEIPYEDKGKVLEMFKKRLSDLIVFHYDFYVEHDGPDLQSRWYNWRTHKLKFDNLENNLPELKGIF